MMLTDPVFLFLSYTFIKDLSKKKIEEQPTKRRNIYAPCEHYVFASEEDERRKKPARLVEYIFEKNVPAFFLSCVMMDGML